MRTPASFSCALPQVSFLFCLGKCKVTCLKHKTHKHPHQPHSFKSVTSCSRLDTSKWQGKWDWYSTTKQNQSCGLEKTCPFWKWLGSYYLDLLSNRSLQTKGEDLLLFLLCQNPVSLKHIFMDCDGFNSSRALYFSVDSYEKIFNEVALNYKQTNNCSRLKRRFCTIQISLKKYGTCFNPLVLSVHFWLNIYIFFL